MKKSVGSSSFLSGIFWSRLTPLAGVAAVVLGLSVLPSQTVVAQKNTPKVTVCHANGQGVFTALSVGANALPAHAAHGDGLPFQHVPGSTTDFFGGECDVASASWSYSVNISPDPSAQTSSGKLLVGSGIPAINFGTARNEEAGIELGMMIHYRQGPTVASADDYADGVLNFNVNDGPQSMINGSSSNVSNRAAWSFAYSFATGLNGVPTSLNDYTFRLLYDVDPGPGTVYRTLALEPWPIPAYAAYSGFLWRDQGSFAIQIADDKGNVNVTQNSENYAFGFFQDFLTSAYGPGNAFTGPAAFDIILQAIDGAQLLALNHVVVNVGGGS